jgi:primosomal protein N'
VNYSWGMCEVVECRTCRFALEIRVRLDGAVVHASAEFDRNPTLKCPNCGGEMRATTPGTGNYDKRHLP